MKVKFKDVGILSFGNCPQCMVYDYEDCADLMLNLTGIDCHKEDVIFKEKETYIQCTKENTKVGDIVYFNESKYKVTYICENISGSGKLICMILNLVENYEFSSYLETFKKKV